MNVIKQIIEDRPYNTTTIKMIVRDNERGPQGPQGEPGETATIAAGQAYSVPTDTQPAVVNTGTSSAAVFDFYIPKGDTGEQGPQGEPGPAGVSGEAATVAIGTTTTLEPDAQATVTNSGTNKDAILNFGIPKGDKGDKGDKGADGAIHYTAGSGIQITSDNVIQATGGVAATWGDITGTLSNQTDLQTALNAKQNILTAGSGISISGNTISAGINNATLKIQKNSTDVATFTANASTDVTANITVPTKVSDLTNDSGFISSVSWSDVSGKPSFATVATSGNYSDLTNRPTIPTVNNSTITITNNNSAVDSFTTNASSAKTIALSYPIITMQTTDPGEGVALAANNFIAVYEP